MTYQPFKNQPVTQVNWSRPDPHQDWKDRCQRNPQSAVFDLLILCEDKVSAYAYLEEEYESQLAVTFPSGNQIVRLKDGRFATVTDRPDQCVGVLPQIEKWNWWGKFNNTPDLSVLREKRQVTDILTLTYN